MKQINIRLLSGEIWVVLNGLRMKDELVVDQAAFTQILDISMEVMARHIGEVLADDEEFPLTPWPHKPFPESDD
jgi:hypothetical protein